MRPGPPEARYANYFEIGHTEAEFILDFGQSYEGEAVVHTRMVIGPGYAKELSRLLWESLEQYEGAYGRIRGQDDHEEPPFGRRRELSDG